jgi:hypothetical protein
MSRLLILRLSVFSNSVCSFLDAFEFEMLTLISDPYSGDVYLRYIVSFVLSVQKKFTNMLPGFSLMAF